MKTRVLTELHIEAPVETVYAFLVDMENTNRLKTSLMGGTVQMVEQTPDWVGTSYRMFRHLFGGLYYEFKARNVEAVPNERVVQTTEGWIMENLLSGTHVLRMRPEGSGTQLTIEIAPPAIERIPVFGSLLGDRIDRSMARMHEPMDAEIKELLEGNKTP